MEDEELTKLFGFDKLQEELTKESKKATKAPESIADIFLSRSPLGEVKVKYTLCKELYDMILENCSNFSKGSFSNGESYISMLPDKNQTVMQIISRYYCSREGDLIEDGAPNVSPLLCHGADKGVEFDIPGLYSEAMLKEWATNAGAMLAAIYTECLTPLNIECHIIPKA